MHTSMVSVFDLLSARIPSPATSVLDTCLPSSIYSLGLAIEALLTSVRTPVMACCARRSAASPLTHVPWAVGNSPEGFTGPGLVAMML